MESSQEKLNAAFYLGESTLFLVDDPAGLEQMYGCFRYLDGGDPQPGDVVRIEDFALPAGATLLEGLAPPPEGTWYLARRITEGAEDSPALERDDRLWSVLTAAP